MISKRNIFVFILPVWILSGCGNTINRHLSYPSDTKWVTVEIKNPSPFTKPFPLEVRYISKKCLKRRISGFDGSVISEPSYNVVRIPLQKMKNSNVWQGRVAITGGGSCKWTLSAINLGVEYVDVSHIGKDLQPGTAVGATVAFDNDASRNGQFETIRGGIISLSSEYFPMIKTDKMIRQVDSVSLFGKNNFMKKRVVGNIGNMKIQFNPKLDESKLVRMIAPKTNNRGDFYKIIYPDGTMTSDGSTHPDVKRLIK